MARLGLIEEAVVLAEGKFSVFGAKTASCILRYAAESVVAVLDSTNAGRTAQDVIGFGGAIPIVSSVKESLQYKPKQLVIGIAPIGGGLPPEYRRIVVEAIKEGLDIVSGLHYILSDDEELYYLAQEHSVKLLDVRRPPDSLTVSSDEARFLPVFRVLTVGSDCSVGKMVVSYEIARFLRSRGINAQFCATGQTGIMLSGWGIAVDRVISDFVAGAAEALVKAVFDADIALVEGQGTVYHPAYSGVTLSLLHGSCPNVMILCHHLGRTHIKSYDVPIPPLKKIIHDYEYLSSFTHPSKVIGIGLNTVDSDEETAKTACKQIASELKLPVTDCIRFGPEPLANAVLEEYKRWKSLWKR
ncbi:MAG: DUF1611 domain-containing protein [Planctomycetota bacterium]|nr:DUF1611 domain-containing protein [Planctomycetota bacterium]